MGLHFILFLLPALNLISAHTVQNSFITPQPPSAAGNYTGNLVWPLGSAQTIQWTSNFSTYQLLIFQDNDEGGEGTTLTTGSKSGTGQQDGSFIWDVTTLYNIVATPVFWFILCEGTYQNSTSFNSHYFNITSPTSSSSSSTSSSTSLSTSSTIASSPTNTHTSVPELKLSTGAKIGVGITIPVFVIAVSIVGFYYWRRSKRSKTVTNEPQYHAVGPAYGLFTSGYSKPELPAHETQRYELGERRDSSGNGIQRHGLGET